MRNTKHVLWLGTVLCGVAMAAPGTSPVVGVAQSHGQIRLNQVAVPGGATLFDGAAIQTGTAASDVNLKAGGHLLLASASAATIHQDRAQLTSGVAELSGNAAYRIQARNLEVTSADPAARVRVGISSAGRINVEATSGTAEVRNRQGVLVARVLPGTALQLKEVADQQTKLTGTVTFKNSTYFLTDDTTKVTVELRGKDLEKLKNKHVAVNGTVISGTPAAGASQIVQVASTSKAKAVAAGAAAGGAAGGAAAGTAGGAAAAGAATAAGTAAGISAATVAVVGGVAATAATVGGLAAAGALPGQGDSNTVSR